MQLSGLLGACHGFTTDTALFNVVDYDSALQIMGVLATHREYLCWAQGNTAQERAVDVVF